jgi:hypothetical protein
MKKSSKKALTHHKKMIISCPEPTEWMFCDFSPAPGKNPIQDWVDGLSEVGETMFWSLLKINRKIPIPLHWTQLRYLKGNAQKHRLWELRFTADDKKYRVIGIFSPDFKKRAILLIGCSHKQNVYDPPEAIETAITRKKMLEKQEATAIERPIPTDR